MSTVDGLVYLHENEHDSGNTPQHYTKTSQDMANCIPIASQEENSRDIPTYYVSVFENCKLGYSMFTLQLTNCPIESWLAQDNAVRHTEEHLVVD